MNTYTKKLAKNFEIRQAHSWIYKDIRGFRNKKLGRYEIIKEQTENIFKKYIIKLTSRFESIAKQIR